MPGSQIPTLLYRSVRQGMPGIRGDDPRLRSSRLSSDRLRITSANFVRRSETVFRLRFTLPGPQRARRRGFTVLIADVEETGGLLCS